MQWATLVALDGRTARALSDATQQFDPERLNPALPVTRDYTQRAKKAIGGVSRATRKSSFAPPVREVHLDV